MDARMIVVLVAGAGVVGVVVWLLAKIGHLLIKIAEALAAAAAVAFAMWLVIKAGVWTIRQAFTRWRTSLILLAVTAWSHWWSGLSLVLAVAWSQPCSPGGA